MKRLIQWFTATHRSAKCRAKIILAAKDRMAHMDGHWRQEADKSTGQLAELLMNLGLVYIEVIYQNQTAAQNLIRSRQAPLN